MPDASQRARPAGSVFFYAFVAFVLLAPVYKGGARAIPLALLELAAVGFLFTIFVVRGALPPIPRALKFAIAILIAYPLLQMLPLPDAWWRAIPGHAEYAIAIDHFAAPIDQRDSNPIPHSISIVPAATEDGWLALLPPLACLLAVQRLRIAAVIRLLLAMTVFAGMEGLLGLLQVGAGGNTGVYRSIDGPSSRAAGTFVNPDHLAAFLAMMLPVMIGLLLYGATRNGRGSAHDDSAGIRPFESNRFSRRTLLFASAVMISLCLVFTWSRAGIASALVGLAGTALLLPFGGGGKRARWLVLGLLALVVPIAVVIGITPILERMGPQQMAEALDFRFLITAQTFQAAMVFFPWGSGLSTLESVFPRFQTGPLPFLVDYAHNDYVQAFMELGFAAPVVVLLLLVGYVGQLLKLAFVERRRGATVVRLAAGLGLIPLILHSAFDFALHVPAISMWFATLAGVFFHPGDPHGEHTARVVPEDRPNPTNSRTT